MDFENPKWPEIAHLLLKYGMEAFLDALFVYVSFFLHVP